MSDKDQIYCASPNCTNKCGRKMSEEHREALSMILDSDYPFGQLSQAFFCGEPCEDGQHDWEPEAGQTRCSKCGKEEIWF